MYNKYLETIIYNLNLLPENMYFKSDYEYRGILEHVSNEYGLDYLNQIKEDFEIFYNKNKDKLIDLCKTNDKYGKPLKCDYKDFVECSPSNLRYIYHALINLEYMKKNNINDIDIIEIGGGYGGLCFFINKLAILYDINIKSYTIFDLDKVLELQKLYLNLLDIKDVNLFTLDKLDITKLNNNSYGISNYGFSEFNNDIQNRYINEIINKYISNGLFIYNFYNKFINFTTNSITIVDEKPITPNDNKFIYF